MSVITEKKLNLFYLHNKRSVSEIAKILQCSEGKINYWLKKYNIKKRNISEAIYQKKNPKGDPFVFRFPKTKSEAELFGLGIGLYWGEGNRANKNTVKLGNSDPALLRNFIKFLHTFFNIRKSDLKFHLHLFSDIDPKQATKYWTRELKINQNQFYKPTITQTGKLGTYKKKSSFGVLTVYYGNTKVRNKLISLLPL